jgi:hypothetical protein
MTALINVEKTTTCLEILKNKILTCLAILQNKINRGLREFWDEK